MMPSAIAGLCILLGAGPSFAGPDARPQAIAMTTQSRPFPVVEFQLGDAPFVIPKDWVDSKFVTLHRGGSASISVLNANDRRWPRPTEIEFPPLVLFVVRETAPGLLARNLRDDRAEWDRRWPERRPDQDGFWEWKRQEYMLVEPRHARPRDQPLIVGCSRSLRPDSKHERQCTVSFYWTLATSVRYDFYDMDVPQSQWVDLDRQVIELLQFLDGRKPWLRRNAAGTDYNIPANCQSWFDGCNYCNRLENGKIYCTAVACSGRRPAFRCMSEQER